MSSGKKFSPFTRQVTKRYQNSFPECSTGRYNELHTKKEKKRTHLKT
jgi:hypothetical protein